MNETIALKKEIKNLKSDIYVLGFAFIILMIASTYTISHIDPKFDAKTKKSYEILKGLYIDMKGNKNDVKGIIIENLDWRTIG